LYEAAGGSGVTVIMVGADGRVERRTGKLALGNVVLDLDAHVVKGAGGEIHLTPRECILLQRLVVQVNSTVPRTDLVRAVWGDSSNKGVHSLRVLIKNLRRKIEPDPVRPRYLVTESAVGYRLQLP
jgi:two-component system KDP operon response regulator KdpE